jgi:hypothetical protein
MTEKKLVGKTLLNGRLGMPDFIGGRRLVNANGDIDPSSSGYQYLITTLSYIRAEVVKQIFYEISIEDYVPMDVGEAAWMEEIVQNLQYNTGGSFYDGDINTQEYTGRLSNVGAGISPIRMPVKTWGKRTGWTIMEIAMAAAANKWDVVEAKLESLKKNWDLGIQETAFLGHPDGTLTGLLNDSEVNINTTLITEQVSGMSGAEFQTFVAGLLNAFYDNSNSTILPNTYIMPTDDYLGMVAAASPDYPNISKLEYLLNALKKATANESFKILPLTYSQAAINNTLRGLNKNRHVLYRRDPKTLSMTIPVDFNMLQARSVDEINWAQAAYGQYSGTLVTRKREVLYLDETAGS